MTRILFIMLFITTTVPVFSQNKDIEALTQLNKDWINSYPQKDAATLNNIFADDFIMITGNGSKLTKKDIINSLPNQETVSVHIDNVDVRLLTSDVGLITAYTSFELMDNGKKITGRNCYQDVYVKRNNKWVAVAAHVTILGMK
jgi:uncharacterized protein (TIGR02246 family)